MYKWFKMDWKYLFGAAGQLPASTSHPDTRREVETAPSSESRRVTPPGLSLLIRSF